MFKFVLVRAFLDLQITTTFSKCGLRRKLTWSRESKFKQLYFSSCALFFSFDLYTCVCTWVASCYSVGWHRPLSSDKWNGVGFCRPAGWNKETPAVVGFKIYIVTEWVPVRSSNYILTLVCILSTRNVTVLHNVELLGTLYSRDLPVLTVVLSFAMCFFHEISRKHLSLLVHFVVTLELRFCLGIHTG